MEEVHQKIEGMLNMIRDDSSPLHDYELELRVGFVRNGRFETGYSTEFRDIPQKIIKLLTLNCQRTPNVWSMHPQHVYMVAEYKQGIRKSHAANTPSNQYTQKKKVAQFTMITNRPQDLRVTLSTEKKITPEHNRQLMQELKHVKPVSMRMIQRASFFEQISMEHRFRYDISKVTPKQLTKIKCASQPCFYHVELELEHISSSADKSLSNTLTDQETNRWIIQKFLERGLQLLGTHVNTGLSTKSELPQPCILDTLEY